MSGFPGQGPFSSKNPVNSHLNFGQGDTEHGRRPRMLCNHKFFGKKIRQRVTISKQNYQQSFFFFFSSELKLPVMQQNMPCGSFTYRFC